MCVRVTHTRRGDTLSLVDAQHTVMIPPSPTDKEGQSMSVTFERITLEHPDGRIYAIWAKMLADKKNTERLEVRHNPRVDLKRYVAHLDSIGSEIFAVSCPVNNLDTMIGTVKIDYDRPNQVATIGYMVDHAMSGRGVATKAVQFATDRAFGSGMRMVLAGVHGDHDASIRVLLKCGFRHAGRIQDRFIKGNKPVAQRFYSKDIREDQYNV